MPIQRFFPSSEPAQIAWCNNYAIKLAIHGPACGEAAGTITATQADLAYYVWVIEKWHPQIKADAEEATAYKKLIAQGGTPGMSPIAAPVGTLFTLTAAPPALVAPGVLNRLFQQIARIKASPGYLANSEMIGQDLKIIGAEDTTEHLVPEFKLTVGDGVSCQCVQIDFTKFKHKGVYIECRRNAGAWAFLAIDGEKPYIDNQPLLAAPAAETREYRLRYWDNEPNGDWSPVQKVSVGV